MSGPKVPYYFLIDWSLPQSPGHLWFNNVLSAYHPLLDKSDPDSKSISCQKGHLSPIFIKIWEMKWSPSLGGELKRGLMLFSIILCCDINSYLFTWILKPRLFSKMWKSHLHDISFGYLPEEKDAWLNLIVRSSEFLSDANTSNGGQEGINFIKSLKLDSKSLTYLCLQSWRDSVRVSHIIISHLFYWETNCENKYLKHVAML